MIRYFDDHNSRYVICWILDSDGCVYFKNKNRRDLIRSSVGEYQIKE